MPGASYSWTMGLGSHPGRSATLIHHCTIKTVGLTLLGRQMFAFESESESGLLPGRFTRTRNLTWCRGAYIKVKQELKTQVEN